MVTSRSITSTRSTGRLAARIVMTLLGAAGLVVGAVLTWTDGILGTDLSVRALYQTTFEESDSFVRTVGFVAVVLGLSALVGLLNPTGWLTRMAGMLGVVMFVLFAVQVYRSDTHEIDTGAWLAAAGAVVALVGGFFGHPRLLVWRVPPGRYR